MAMKGNDREIQRQLIEDKIIRQIDGPVRVLKPRKHTPILKVPIIDLLQYKYQQFGYIIKAA